MDDPCDKVNHNLRDICRCERAGMTLEQCNRRRVAWGVAPLVTMPSSEPDPPPVKPMTTPEKIATFVSVTANTVWRYVTFQPGMLSKEEMQPRIDICLACPNLVDGHCSLCGCACNSENKPKFLSKLAHRASQCPDDPPRWKAIT